MDIITIPSRNGKRTYQVFLGIGYPLQPQEFRVVARNSVMALDIVADYCEEHELKNLCISHERLVAICPKDKTLDEFIKINKLTRCGSNGIYVVVEQINEL